MRSNTKIICKKHKIRNIIFDRRSISRQDLAKISKLNYRSLIKYTDELKKQRLIYEDVSLQKRGRPSIVYRSNSKNVFFAGISYILNELYFSAIDINANLLMTSKLEIPEDATAEMFINMAINWFEKMIKALDDKILYAIGFNESHYLQSGKRLAAFRTLSLTMRKKYGAPIELYDNDSVMLLKIAWNHGLSGSIGALIPGDEIRLSLVSDGCINNDANAYLREFKHWRVDKKSPVRCSCGKHGCVESLLTYNAIIARYHSLIGEKSKTISTSAALGNLAAQCEAGSPYAVKTYKEIGHLMALCMIKVKKDLRLEHLFLFPADKTYFKYAAEAYKLITGNELNPFYYHRFSNTDAIVAPAEMMRNKLFTFSAT